MMRCPTPSDTAYAWHRDAMLGPYGDGLPTNDEPQCGWFKRRLVRGGPFVPARIWLYAETDPETGELLSDEALQCEVNGQWADPVEAWPWLCGNPISEQEFNYMTAMTAYALEFEPANPLATPLSAIDINTTPITF